MLAEKLCFFSWTGDGSYNELFAYVGDALTTSPFISTLFGDLSSLNSGDFLMSLFAGGATAGSSGTFLKDLADRFRTKLFLTDLTTD